MRDIRRCKRNAILSMKKQWYYRGSAAILKRYRVNITIYLLSTMDYVTSVACWRTIVTPCSSTWQNESIQRQRTGLVWLIVTSFNADCLAWYKFYLKSWCCKCLHTFNMADMEICRLFSNPIAPVCIFIGSWLL